MLRQLCLHASSIRVWVWGCPGKRNGTLDGVGAIDTFVIKKCFACLAVDIRLIALITKPFWGIFLLNSKGK